MEGRCRQFHFVFVSLRNKCCSGGTSFQAASLSMHGASRRHSRPAIFSLPNLLSPDGHMSHSAAAGQRRKASRMSSTSLGTRLFGKHAILIAVLGDISISSFVLLQPRDLSHHLTDVIARLHTRLGYTTSLMLTGTAVRKAMHKSCKAAASCRSAIKRGRQSRTCPHSCCLTRSRAPVRARSSGTMRHT